MDATTLHRMIDRVRDGRLSRRGFIRRMAALGLTAPMANQLLAIGGVAMAQPASDYKPTKAGGGGMLKVLWWQAATLLNPHFAVGTKDQDGSLEVLWIAAIVVAGLALGFRRRLMAWLTSRLSEKSDTEGD